MIAPNLPKQLTPFVGREAEIAEICGLLNQPDCRLLSLIGPAGMGKTRLSLEIAERQHDQFADGVYFIALQPLISVESLVSAIASSVDIEFHDTLMTSQEQLLDYLSSTNMLLVMDSFEGVLQGADLVASVLAAAPNLKILVTSREALKLRQEWIRPVSGMLFPDDVQAHEINAYGAVRLFIDRAQQLRSHFAVEEELPHIIRICQLVGGMPLGIELAVAWLKTLSCAEIASEIQKNVDLLTAQMRDIPERHQSIRAVFDSTWQMLTAEERTVFMSLSVFRDVPSRQAIQTVTGASLLALTGLVDKALLIPVENGRYRIHELLRQYAYEKLEESDEHGHLQNAHSDYYLRFLHALQSDVHGRRQVQALDEITLDFENIRLAWHRALECMNYDGIRIAVETIGSYLHVRSRWKQDSYLLTQAQDCFAPLDGQKPHRVWAMVVTRNYLNQDDPLAMLEQALAVAREYDDEAEIGLNLQLTGFYYANQRKYAEAINYLEQTIPYFIATRDDYHLASSYGTCAIYYRLLANYEKSVTYNEKSLTLRRAIGDINGQIYATAELSNTMFVMGNLQDAEYYRREALLLAEQLGSVWNIVWQKWELATYHYLYIQGNLPEAKRIIHDTEHFNEGVPMKGGLMSLSLSKSLFAVIDEDYDEARHYGQNAVKVAKKHVWYPIYSVGVMAAACGQGDYDSAATYNYELLTYFSERRVVPFMLLGIAFSAILSAYQDKNPRKATELLALVLTHPSSMSGWLKQWAYIDRLQTQLEDELGTNTYQASWERGENLDWEQVVTGLLTEYENKQTATNGNGSIPVHVMDANSELGEPLSERELEVLLKIAQGLSNRQIAEQLYVGVSTVKKHITHIYGKLQAESRTQALLRAQEIRLI